VQRKRGTTKATEHHRLHDPVIAIDLNKFATARMWCCGDDESHEQEKIKSAEFLPGNNDAPMVE
jgi:hypothetical protein